MITELHTTDVDSEGLLQVLGENLYSTPEVAVRELVQNAHDSCVRRRVEDKAAVPEARIDVSTELDHGTLTIRDNGAGLTQDEVRRYLATIGAGYTRVLRRETGDGSLIGAFGLGFLSAYVISELVEVTTTSYQDPDKTWLFRTKDGLRYSLEPAPSRAVGTEVKLKLRRKFRHLSGPEFVGALLERYCCLLPTAIHAPEPVNAEPPSWRSDPELGALRRYKLHLETAKRFDRVFEPLCAWEIEPAEDVDVRGVIWLQDGGSWATSDTRRVSIFVRGMLVDDDAPRALPDWAGFAGAAIECDALTPTASREAVQRDEVWNRLVLHLRRSMVEGLALVASQKQEAWRRVVARHSQALRAASVVEPELFELLQHELRLPTSEGDLRMAEAERRAPGKIFLSVGDDVGYELLIHRALSQPVLDGTHFGVAAFSRLWCEAHGKKLLTLGTRSGNEEVFRPAAVDPQRDRALKGLLGAEELTVVPSHFDPVSLPVVWVPDREVELKKRLEDDEADRRISAGILGLARRYTAAIEDDGASKLFVNLDSPLVRKLLAAPPERAEPAARVLRSVAHLSTRGGHTGGDRLADALGELGTALEALLGPARSF